MKYPEGLDPTFDETRVRLGSAVRRLGHAVIGREVDLEAMEAAIKKFPAQRWCQPSEIAKLAAFLGGDEADFVHGSEYVMDGGWLAAARDPF